MRIRFFKGFLLYHLTSSFALQYLNSPMVSAAESNVVSVAILNVFILKGFLRVICNKTSPPLNDFKSRSFLWKHFTSWVLSCQSDKLCLVCVMLAWSVDGSMVLPGIRMASFLSVREKLEKLLCWVELSWFSVLTLFILQILMSCSQVVQVAGCVAPFKDEGVCLIRVVTSA